MRRRLRWPALVCAGAISIFACAPAMASAAAAGAMPWWGWALALFFVCFILGIVAVPAGVGGGVLFVPIVGGFFPFHLDFVRGAGLMVALGSALAASPSLLRSEERRVGKECRSRWSPEHEEEKLASEICGDR